MTYKEINVIRAQIREIKSKIENNKDRINRLREDINWARRENSRNPGRHGQFIIATAPMENERSLLYEENQSLRAEKDKLYEILNNNSLSGNR